MLVELAIPLLLGDTGKFRLNLLILFLPNPLVPPLGVFSLQDVVKQRTQDPRLEPRSVPNVGVAFWAEVALVRSWVIGVHITASIRRTYDL